MRMTIYFTVLVNVVFLAFATSGRKSHFVPRPGNVHLGSLAQARRWGRWCTYDNECGFGFCQAYMCQCYYGYITWHFMETCSYQQRSKLTAFLLSFFVGTLGIDWFFLSRGNAGYIVAGIIKLLISLGCCIGWPFTFASKEEKSRKYISISSFINAILTVASVIWWLIDWIRILSNVFYDGNGAPLQRWGYYDNYNRIPYRV
ncbi:unnamed protein product [Rotaria magnacalcarata]|uniref:TM2 domain-containing protein n=1 Tax=Rotaria magnacalcarata TaxID=392030 RepID=A0A816H278_9BILA|nr:unnamed protein product [Rotaria magnacalcarata]CAF1683003.1 unnamed protein product [Rotaria magnacalcarata]CAF1926950.1 unnamed protein product [Rotaria magnacalcarata]CAF1947124.1 unnamed protein product [Rotaria magnacalcarata]CAF2105820.1 unnamed protein product [Rotaria magnacalcarata]